MNVLLHKRKLEQAYIPVRYQRAVTLHIIKNILKTPGLRTPLILGIHGPSGEGKTFQLETILKKMGVKQYLISGGQFENALSGQPAQIVRTTYIKASEGMRSGECTLAVVLINDIDTGLGMVGNGQGYTINQQTVFGELMHLVDYPNSVEGRETSRVPIIITGNDLSRLYQPLIRAGRMASFEWFPNLEERTDIIARIYPELTRDECKDLILELNRKWKVDPNDQGNTFPIAFYSHLRSTLIDEDLWEKVEQLGVGKAIDEIMQGNEPDFSLGIRYERVLEKGIELANTNQFVNHLKSRR